MAETWTYTTGEYGHTVTAYEKRSGGPLYVRYMNPTTGKQKFESLKHRDRIKAERHADELAPRLKHGTATDDDTPLTVTDALAYYEAYKTSRKTPKEQDSDRRRLELWRTVLGRAGIALVKDLDDYMMWEDFVDARKTGVIDGRGRFVSTLKDAKGNPAKPKPVRARSVEADCQWLCLVVNWLTYHKLKGKRVLAERPVSVKELRKRLGKKYPSGKKTARHPVAGEQRYRAVRDVTDDVSMWYWKDGKRAYRRSYLSDILDLVYDQGRRLSAVLNVRHKDYLVDQTDEHGNAFAHGAILWRGEFDKEGNERIIPLGPIGQAAIKRAQQANPGIGDAPLFPSRDDPTQPIDRRVARAWLLKAEGLAGVLKQDGSLWHAYRRGWATALQHLPANVVAETGGWGTVAIMEACYQNAPKSKQLDVVLERQKHA